MVITYSIPRNWIAYDLTAISTLLIEAKSTLLALTSMPRQRSWTEKLQVIQLKQEIAGTSKIEGAEFYGDEFERAMSGTPEQLATRSQKQAAAAAATYRWLETIPTDKRVNADFILSIHKRIVTGCDDDRCRPGALRKRDENVTFGIPRHQGVEGGEPCALAFNALIEAAQSVFPRHDPLVQAFAFHYHIAAMHPFLDGNGRTVRALESFLLRKAGMRDTLCIAMSNYYNENKEEYLRVLADTREKGHDLTAFIAFALRGLTRQCANLLAEIAKRISKEIYRNTVADLFGRLESKKSRVLSERHEKILNLFLEKDEIPLPNLPPLCQEFYHVKNFRKMLLRDMNRLIRIRAILPENRDNSLLLKVNLKWSEQISDSLFLKRIKAMPKSRIYPFLSR
ncbi:MAG: Fic family protein [Puniceicoccales bacterium]|jgi:Fic family protein|nr:Fic family protein [Puniceicoccales bacterium]